MLSQLVHKRSQPQDTFDTARAVTGVMLSAAQPLAAYLSQLTGHGMSEVERARQTDGPVTPADGAFAIWGPLFIGSLTWAGWSAMDAQRSDPALRRIGWLACGAFASNIAWSTQAQLSSLGWPSFGIISAAAASANAALIEASRKPRAQLASWTLGPLAGWLSLAAFANLEATLNTSYGRPAPAIEERRAAAFLCAGTLIAAGTTVASRGSLPYSAAVAWGLGGTALRNLRSKKPLVTLTACACLATLAGITWAAQR